jgi:hypothetical protein
MKMDEPLNPTKKACWDKAEEALAAVNGPGGNTFGFQVPLVAGTAAFAVPGVTANSAATANVAVAAGADANTVGYRVTCGAGTVNVKAVAAGMGDNAAGTETVNVVGVKKTI